MARKLTWLEQKWERENQMLEYEAKFELYLERNRESFLSKWAEICEKTSGRVSYDEMAEVLGRDFSRE